MILFVDDEPRIMDSFRGFLERQLEAIGKKLKFFSNVDEAMDFYNKNSSNLELVILDVMMPGGKSFDFKKSNGGLKTGFLFYQEIRKDLPKIPIFVFTNSIAEDVKNEIEKDKNAKFLQKRDYLLPDFWNEVRDCLK
jgi:CheY-like chemotaxis protein